MSFSYIAGIIVGIVFVLALVVVFKVVLKKNGLIRKGIYDERQQIEKGKGFMQGIFVEYGITEDDNTGNARNGGFGSTDKKA